MNIMQFVDAMQAASWPDEVVWARDTEGKIYRVASVEREEASDDGEGHQTSLGTTIWIKIEEY